VKLTAAQLDRIRRQTRQWEGTPAPCGIPYADPYSPCLPEDDDDGRLICLTCRQRQILALEPP
jgi:hypothetical protein